MDRELLRQQLLEHCKTFVVERSSRILKQIASIQESLQSETKSSAGDKHETGRAMLQLEREKAGKQLAEAQKLQENLAKISQLLTLKQSESSAAIVKIGSLVYTSQANYFISISAGQFIVNEEKFFAIAAASPIGRLLLGKKAKEQIVFNGTTIDIHDVQ